MKYFVIVLLSLLSPLLSSLAHAEPLIAGHAGQDGVVLFGELNCGACHQPAANETGTRSKQSPRLGMVGARVSPEYLHAFLSNPQQTKPGTPMPDLLHNLPAENREAAIGELVQFLASLGGPFTREPNVADPKLIERGKLLYHTVGCVACHQPFEGPPKHKIDPNAPPVDEDEGEKNSPSLEVVPLPNLSHKTTLSALASFLHNPLSVRPAGRMPGMGLSADEAKAIAAYLLRNPREQLALFAFKPDEAQAARGKERFVSLGCAACHDTARQREPEKVDLTLLAATVVGYDETRSDSPGNEGPKNAIDGNPQTKYLNFGKLGSGLMMTIPGKPLIASGLAITSANDSPERDPAAFLLEGSSDEGKTFVRIAEGKLPEFKDRFQTQTVAFDNEQAFSILRFTVTAVQNDSANCTQYAELQLFASHKALPGVTNTFQSPTLAKLNAAGMKSCVAEKPTPGRPFFAVSEAQRKLLLAAVGELQAPAKPIAAAQQIERSMTAMNCYACHARGKNPGADPRRNNYFVYDVVVDFGDEGRLPPALHDVGAKLTPAGFDDMLLNGQRYRTYMATRMPQFGKANVGHLPSLLTEADAGKVPAHAPALSAKLVEDGRRLVGKKSLACVNCHAWGPNRLPGAEGLDLLLTVRRLQPAWFHALLLDPQQVRPRTRMPTSWPQGKSFFPDVQGGDPHKQIDAIWAYLNQGEKGGLPEGMKGQKKGPLLTPGDEPLVFRTFVDQVGALAILVGFPQRTHVAFDADRVRMVLAWEGDFIATDAAWEGRAGQYAKIPAQNPVKFPEGPTFAVLESAAAAWPADLPKPKFGSTRTPEGWRFRGYRFDEQRRPTFLYNIGEIAVEDMPDAGFRDDGVAALRTLRLTSPSDVPNLYFRVAAGNKIVEANGVYTVDERVRLRLTSSSKTVPQIRISGNKQELLLPVEFAASKTGVREVKINVEMSW